MKILISLLSALRPKQWTKNLILFAGWLFSLGERQFTWAGEWSLFGRAGLGFLAFCMLSSAVYLFNDIIDVEADRRHPRKRRRPIASGEVPIPAALAAALILAAAGTALGFALHVAFGWAAVVYLALFCTYSLLLKQVPILDSMVIATGFVIRAIAGAVAVHVSISSWLIICTIFLALFLGFGKRHSELVMLGEGASSHRDTLAHYSTDLLELLLGICATLALASYTLYSISPHALEKFGPDVLLTMPFVMFGLFRYLYLIVQEHRGGDPASVLLSDLPLLLTVVCWGALAAALLVARPALLSGILF